MKYSHLFASLLIRHDNWHSAGKTKKYVNHFIITGHHRTLLDLLQIDRLVRENLKTMIALFIISLAVFIYMLYVLIKPEKF